MVLERPTPELIEQLKGAGLPVSRLAHQYKLDECYRDKEGGHLAVWGFAQRGSTPLLLLRHGADSLLPGVGVSDHEPEKLKPCGCGKWAAPTDEEAELNNRLFELHALAGRNVPEGL